MATPLHSLIPSGVPEAQCMILHRVLILLGVAGLMGGGSGASAGPATDGCPTNVIFLGSDVVTSTLAAFDTSSTIARCSYNLVAGSAFMEQDCTLAGASTHVQDDYEIRGIPLGSAVTVRALLTVEGAVWTAGCGGSGCGGLYSARLIHGNDVDQVEHADHLYSGRAEHHDVLELSVTMTPGQPERIEVDLSGRRSPGGNHASNARAVLMFSRVPPGATIVSCQGFAGGVMPAGRTSWGTLKSTYR